MAKPAEEGDADPDADPDPDADADTNADTNVDGENGVKKRKTPTKRTVKSLSKDTEDVSADGNAANVDVGVGSSKKQKTEKTEKPEKKTKSPSKSKASKTTKLAKSSNSKTEAQSPMAELANDGSSSAADRIGYTEGISAGISTVVPPYAGAQQSVSLHGHQAKAKVGLARKLLNSGGGGDGKAGDSLVGV